MSTTTTLPQISLYYKEGSSDKEYHVSIVGSDNTGYTVKFQYGRRGSKLRDGVKNAVPVDLPTAMKIYDKVVADQRKDGYTEGETGTPYVGTENQGKVSGVLPQLLNFIDEEEVQKYLNDDSYIMQEKKDGVRCMIVKKKRVVEGVNKRGLVTSLPKTTEEAVRKACGDADATLDGELVGEVFWIFDMLSIGIHAFSASGYTTRVAEIQDWLGDGFGEYFRMVPTAVGKASKKALYNKLKKENAEGIVFKKNDAPYKAGRPASGGNQVKFKFYATATVRVRAINGDKRSVQMEVLNKGDWTTVGSVTIPANQEIPGPGKYIEVRYLYAYPGGSLFQPTCLGTRDDVIDDDCLMSQLKYKQGSQEDDDENAG